MTDPVLERVMQARAEKARIDADLLARQVRIELARTKRIDAMRAEAEERHRRERAQIVAAGGYASPALIRYVREAKAQGSAREQRRRQQLQALADTYAAHHGDTPTLQAERRDAMQIPAAYYRPARSAA